MDEKIRNVPVAHVQADEIWGFVFKKEKHKRSEESDNTLIGDAYTFVAIESHSKLVLCFELGRRDWPTTLSFIDSLRSATRDRFQFTTDGFRPYIDTVEHVFGAEIDFSQLVKIYSSDESTRERYSPGEVIGAIPTPIMGDPDPDRISTSHVERQSLTIGNNTLLGHYPEAREARVMRLVIVGKRGRADGPASPPGQCGSIAPASRPQ